MTKQKFFDLIGGDQIHDMCKYLIGLGYDPHFDYSKSDGRGEFGVYGHTWYQFTTPTEGNATIVQTGTPYNLTVPLIDQYDSFFQAMDGLIEWL